jgi:hypothetical protein
MIWIHLCQDVLLPNHSQDADYQPGLHHLTRRLVRGCRAGGSSMSGARIAGTTLLCSSPTTRTGRVGWSRMRSPTAGIVMRLCIPFPQPDLTIHLRMSQQMSIVMNTLISLLSGRMVQRLPIQIPRVSNSNMQWALLKQEGTDMVGL